MSANYRIAIVGAASIRGKELNEALGESPFASADFVLMDDQDAIGQLESVGDEVTFIQQITPSSFAHTDFTFFTGSPDLTRKHWETAAHAGSAIIDSPVPSIRRRTRWCSHPGSGSLRMLSTCRHPRLCPRIPPR